MTPAEFEAYKAAISKALASNPEVVKYAGGNSADSILNAYTSGDWSSITSLSGQPFTKKQQQAAVTDAERALAPAYRAQEAVDRDEVVQALEGDQQAFGSFQESEAKDFGATKDEQDLEAANQGVLFSGSRVQKLKDLRQTYADRERASRELVGDRMRTTARNYQYTYGDDAARSIKDLYNVPGQSNFNANVAGGKVTPNKGLSSLYNTKDFNFQGTAPVAQKAAVQTRAAGLLANRANKLTSTGYKNQF